MRRTLRTRELTLYLTPLAGVLVLDCLFILMLPLFIHALVQPMKK